jgi:hypothetical protein
MKAEFWALLDKQRTNEWTTPNKKSINRNFWLQIIWLTYMITLNVEPKVDNPREKRV